LHGAFAGRASQSEIQVNRLLTFTQKNHPDPELDLYTGKNTPATIYGEVEEHLTGSSAHGPWRSLWQGTQGGWEVEGHSSLSHGASVDLAGGPVGFEFELLGSPISFT
jgi:hypothetical protein